MLRHDSEYVALLENRTCLDEFGDGRADDFRPLLHCGALPRDCLAEYLIDHETVPGPLRGPLRLKLVLGYWRLSAPRCQRNRVGVPSVIFSLSFTSHPHHQALVELIIQIRWPVAAWIAQHASAFDGLVVAGAMKPWIQRSTGGRTSSGRWLANAPLSGSR